MYIKDRLSVSGCLVIIYISLGGSFYMGFCIVLVTILRSLPFLIFPALAIYGKPI